MTHEEHHDIIHILTTETWAVRPKLLEYMKTVKVEEPPTVEEVLMEPEPTPEVSSEPEPELGPWKEVQEQYLSGKEKVDYPEFNGPPTI